MSFGRELLLQADALARHVEEYGAYLPLAAE